MKTTSLVDQLNDDGFCLPEGTIDPTLLDELDRVFDRPGHQAGRRDLLNDEPVAQGLLRDSFLCRLVGELFDEQPFVVRATLFDKQPDANWSVTWHQDQAIAVDARHDCAGFGPWSMKNGVPHVEPPVQILEGITAIRLHLEECSLDHGPLVVSPGTHKLGRLIDDRIQAAVQSHGEQTLTVAAGAVVVIKPLTLHRSSKMAGGKRRRVIHLDCTDQHLPPPLAWKYNGAFTT